MDVHTFMYRPCYSMGMSMKHVARYIRELRDAQGMSREELADDLAEMGIEVSATSIYRIEERGQRPGGELLIGLVVGVRGSLEHLRQLLSDEATLEQAHQLASQRHERIRTVEGQLDVLLEEDPTSVEAAIRELRSGLERLEQRLGSAAFDNGNI